MRIMGNVGKMGENRIIEQQRSDKNYRRTKKVRSKFRYVFFLPSEENRIIEQQGTVNNRTFVLLNFRSIILFSPIFPHLPGDFLRFHGDFIRFHGDSMGFHGNFMGFHGDFLRFHGDFIGFLGPRKRFYNSIINFSVL